MKQLIFQHNCKVHHLCQTFSQTLIKSLSSRSQRTDLCRLSWETHALSDFLFAITIGTCHLISPKFISAKLIITLDNWSRCHATLSQMTHKKKSATSKILTLSTKFAASSRSGSTSIHSITLPRDQYHSWWINYFLYYLIHSYWLWCSASFLPAQGASWPAAGWSFSGLLA